jgi:hypothetical protein
LATVDALPRRCADAASRRPARAPDDEEDFVSELKSFQKSDRFQRSPGETRRSSRSASAPPMRPGGISGLGDDRVPPAHSTAHDRVSPRDDFANGLFGNAFSNGGDDFSKDDFSEDDASDDDGADSPRRTARRVRKAFHARHHKVFAAGKLPLFPPMHPPVPHPPPPEASRERLNSLLDVARGWSALRRQPSSSLDSSDSDSDGSASSMSSEDVEEPTVECFTVDGDACCRADGLLAALDARGGASFSDQCHRANVRPLFELPHR